jgi:flagellum-specific ATP synthase
MMTRGFAKKISMSIDTLVKISNFQVQAKVTAVSGLGIDIQGLAGLVSVGDRIHLYPKIGMPVLAEVVSCMTGFCRVLAYQSFSGLGLSSLAATTLPPISSGLAVHPSWLGRVVDPLGRPLDRRGPLTSGPAVLSTRRRPPGATTRARLGGRIDLGVTSLNLFTTCRQGQRLGIFAGSGVGKSTLMGMLASHTACDVAVIALVGERGREVREFIEDELTAAGLERAVVVVATSDTAPPLRREAALTAMAIAEYFRDLGENVLFMMDSITRYCIALREIAISAGEVPAMRGYPTSVFSELPQFLERAGPGIESNGGVGYITGLFSVLVEGDDMNEPVADSIRGILDGHVVLDRRIAERGRYPAVDVLRSLSRAVPGCNTPRENDLVSRARGILSAFDDVHDLIRLGAYRAGADPVVDEAIELAPRIEALLKQDKKATGSIEGGFAALGEILKQDWK